jgi:hypothetical protein
MDAQGNSEDRHRHPHTFGGTDDTARNQQGVHGWEEVMVVNLQKVDDLDANSLIPVELWTALYCKLH